jgi:hypothetical protein
MDRARGAFTAGGHIFVVCVALQRVGRATA